ncbi:MAG: hypothetical protein ACXW1C_02365, partial [Gallionella sp.]
MLQAHETMDIKIFDVQQNDSLARQILHVYYRTPDPSGEIYSIFPTFFLVQPSIFDAGLLAFNKQEVPLIENCKRLAQLRSGWVGVSPYFDKKFAYHWVKYAVYPFMLGDADAEYQDEFFYLLHQFVVFTQKNPTVYGDLTEDASTDNDVALMLAAIRHNAANMNKKLQHYPEQMLLVFDATWPTSQVKTLLAALEINAKSWNHLFLEHLRYVMRKNKGLVKAVAPVAAIAAEALIQAQHSTPQNALEAVRASNISNALFNSSMVSLDESVRHAETPQFDDV